MKRFLLIGIGGVYNYGCEAIVCGTEHIIHAQWPDAKIVYASYRVADDRRRLADCPVEIVERARIPRWAPQNITRKLLNMAGVAWHLPSDPPETCDGFDAVLSIGGDIYTVKRPQDAGPRGLMRFGDACEKRGAPYVLWGASVGPFPAGSETEQAVTRHLKNISLITAREPVTIEHLRSLGVSNNVAPCADPAFTVAPEIVTQKTGRSDNPLIGINLSPLSVRFAGLSQEETVAAQARTIERLITNLNADIMLIPHVVCDFAEGDDDLRYLRKVQTAIAPEHRNRVQLLDTDPGFVATKRELIKCDLVIAARMHCAINAMTAHVPTVLISYSKKAVGMSNYVYGNDDWVVSMEEFAKESIIEQVKGRIARHEETLKYLFSRIPELQKDAYGVAQRLKNILGKRNIS